MLATHQHCEHWASTHMQRAAEEGGFWRGVDGLCYRKTRTLERNFTKAFMPVSHLLTVSA
jgi:hypothetical protein